MRNEKKPELVTQKEDQPRGENVLVGRVILSLKDIRAYNRLTHYGCLESRWGLIYESFTMTGSETGSRN